MARIQHVPVLVLMSSCGDMEISARNLATQLEPYPGCIDKSIFEGEKIEQNTYFSALGYVHKSTLDHSKAQVISEAVCM